jgi:glucose-6-phosphate-specific signal transduction histidine kinase
MPVFIIKNITLIITLVFLEVSLFFFSLNYIVYEDWVSWYFPVGVNFVSLLLLRFRFWPAIFIGWTSGQIVFNYLYYDLVPDNLLYVYLFDWMEKIPFVLPLIYAKYRKMDFEIERLKGLISVLALALFYRITRSLYLLLNLEYFYGSIPESMLFQVIVAHILGGFVGILLTLMIVYSWRWLQRNHHTLEYRKLLYFFLSLSALLLTTFITYQYQPEVIYLLRVLAILTFIWFAYHFGWIGVVIAGLSFNILILISVYGVKDTNFMLENQEFIITYSLTVLLWGAMVNEHKRISLRLIGKNQNLSANNKKLIGLNKHIQELSERVIQVQEQERKMFSQTLHDELGQNIAALKIGLEIMKSKTSDGMDIVNQSVNDIHSSVYDLMNWVRPSILEDGLFSTLESHYFRERLKNANIKYHLNLLGQNENLSEVLKISIFRIVQEAVTNSIKYSQAENFSIDLIIEDKHLTLNIKDDGVGKQNHSKKQLAGGFGLLGIREKVFAFSGNISIMTENGFEISIKIPTHYESDYVVHL